MVNVIFKDNKNKVFQVMTDLNHNNEMNVYNNREILNKNGNDISVETWVIGIEDDWIKQGYKKDQGLHERLINQYNQNCPPGDFLKRWVR